MDRRAMPSRKNPARAEPKRAGSWLGPPLFPTVDLLRTSPHSAVYILVPGSSDGYQGCMLDIFLYVYIKYIFFFLL